MLTDGLTPIGLDNPEKTMEIFQETGNEMLVKLRELVSSPFNEKVLRTWGIADAAKFVGVSSPTLRKLECADGPLGEPEYDDNKRRIYTLKRINEIREKLGHSFKRPEGSSPMIMTVANFKGGSGKTTTVVHLAHKLALDGLKVLVIDFDPQASTTFICGGLVPDLELEYDDTICTSLLEDFDDVKRVIRHTYFDGIDLIPGNLSLQDVELTLPNSAQNNSSTLGPAIYRLKECLNRVKDNYDVILIDCGPNLGVLTLNAMSASNGLLVPIPPAMFDYASFVMLTGTLRSLFQSVQHNFDFFRLLLTKHSGSNEANQVTSMMRSQFGSYILESHMCSTVEIEKATNDLGSVYDISKPRGSRDTYLRAYHHLEQVNSEILSLIQQVWLKQSQASKVDPSAQMATA